MLRVLRAASLTLLWAESLSLLYLPRCRINLFVGVVREPLAPWLTPLLLWEMLLLEELFLLRNLSLSSRTMFSSSWTVGETACLR